MLQIKTQKQKQEKVLNASPNSPVSLEVSVVQELPLSDNLVIREDGALEVQNSTHEVFVFENVNISDALVEKLHSEVQSMHSEVEDAHDCIHTDKAIVAADKANVQDNKNATQTLKNQTQALKNEVNTLAIEVREAHECIHNDKTIVDADKKAVASDKANVQANKNIVDTKHSEVVSKHSDVVSKHSEVIQMRDEVEADRAEVKASAAAVSTDKATVANNKNETNAAKAAAIAARDEAIENKEIASTQAGVASHKATQATTAANNAKASELAAAESERKAALSAAAATGAMLEAGSVDLSTGTYPTPIRDANGQNRSCFWKVTKGGVVEGVDYGVGDSLIYSVQIDGYYKIDNTESVTSVNGKQGVVVLNAADVGAVDQSEVVLTNSFSNMLGKILRTSNSGELKIPRYLDLHTTGSTANYDIRLDCASSDVLNLIGGSLEVTSGNVKSSGGFGFSGQGNSFRKNGNDLVIGGSANAQSGNLVLETFAGKLLYHRRPKADGTGSEVGEIYSAINKPTPDELSVPSNGAKKVSDPNTAIRFGNYYTQNSTTNTPPGSGTAIFAFTTMRGENDNQLFQIGRFVAGNDDSKVWFRRRWQGSWGSWGSFYTTADKPTASDVGALPITGGTLTGKTVINVDSDAITFKSKQSGNAAKTYLQFTASDGDRLGYVGIGSSSHNNLIITSDQGHIDIVASRDGDKVRLDNPISLTAQGTTADSLTRKDYVDNTFVGKSTGWDTKQAYTVTDANSDPRTWNAGVMGLVRFISTTANKPGDKTGVGILTRYQQEDAASSFNLDYTTGDGFKYNRTWTPSGGWSGWYNIYSGKRKPTLAELSASKGFEYNTKVRKGKWSRIVLLEDKGEGYGGFARITVGATRGGVVYQQTFDVSFSHNQKATITTVDTNKHTTLKVRAVVDIGNKCYFEIFGGSEGDNYTDEVFAVSITSMSAVLSPTRYTNFTDGTTIPSGFKVAVELTTSNRAPMYNQHEIYHEGFKPTAADVGAEPTLAAERKRKITYGTAAPSGGSNGDIYIQYK